MAVCDIDGARATAFSEQYGAKAYTSLQSLLAEEKAVEVLAVCTPNGFHAEHAITALQAGLHVICEKSMCLTTAAVWQLIETEKWTGKKLFVVKSARYNPYLQELKKRLENGSLGAVYGFQLSCFWNRPPAYYTGWHGTQFPDGGTLYTQFSHYIDVLIWLLGPLKTASGFRKNAAHRDIDFEDTGAAAIQLASGVTGSLNWSVNTYEKNYEIGFTLLTANGTFALGGPYLNQVLYAHSKLPFLVPAATQGANHYGSYSGSMSNHDEVYKHFQNLMQNPRIDYTSAFDGMQTVAAIELIYKNCPLDKEA